MKLIFTKSTAPLSILIRWGLKEPVSHFAIVLEDKYVFHSNLLGTNLKWFATFKKHCEIVYSVEVPLQPNQEGVIWDSIVNQYDDHNYDFKAFLYFCWRGLLFRFFGKEFPKVNAWGEERSFLCTGLAKALTPELFPQLLNVQDFEMMSPYKLYKLLEQASIPEKSLD